MSRLSAAAAALICVFSLVSSMTATADDDAGANIPAIELPSPAASDATAAPEQPPPEAAPAASSVSVPASGSSGNGWIARFFWSPQYCDRNRGSREPQCAPVQGFVLRDLIRVRDGKPVEGCSSGPMLLSPRILDQMLQFTRNLPETRASWRIYGRCSGLSEIDYAAYAERVDRRVWWPPAFSPELPDVEITAEALLAAVAAANDTLPVEALSTHCRNSVLESIDMRFDDNLEYVASGSPPAGNCKAKIRVRGKR